MAKRIEFEGVVHEFPDDFTDAEIAAALSSAHPAPPPPAAKAPVASPPRSLLQRTADTGVDVAIGAAKGATNSAIGLGRLFNRYVPGVGKLNEAIYGEPVNDSTYGAAKKDFATPTNTAQKVGFTGEQIGEFFTPVGAAGRIGKAAEIGKSGLFTLAQSDSPLAAGVSAAITAAVPGAAGVRRASEALESGAEKTIAQALGATKEGMKATAADLAPGILTRGIRGSRAAMLKQARSQTAAIGKRIGAEISAAAGRGETVDGAAIRSAIQSAADSLTVADKDGASIPIEGTQAVIDKLNRLHAFVGKLGPDIPVDKAATIKTTWDRIVSKAGLYGAKATASATDNGNAWAIKEAADSFRDLLARGNPTLADLNQEYAFWKGLRTVLTETERRTQAQGGGLVSAGMGGAGAIVGGLSGDSASDRVQNAVIGGVAGRQFIKLIQSPAWRTTVTGPMKQALADALASGNAERVTQAMGRITAATPSLLSRLSTAP